MFANALKTAIDKDLIEVTKTCPICGKQNTVKVHPVSMMAYENGALLQDAFPSLTPAEREIIKTGICSDCWDEMFKDPDEEA